METVREQGPAADPLQEQLDTAEQLARQMTGDDEERFLLVFQALVNVMDGFRARPGEEQRSHARSVLMQNARPHTRARATRSLPRAPTPPAGAPSDSIYADPVFLANARRLIAERERIVGGIPTSEFRDCVAIGSEDGWCCTGTLIAPNVVLTAGHCFGGCTSRVFVGDDVDAPEEGQVIDVAQAVRHPEFVGSPLQNDLTVLILAEEASVEPRPLAEDGMLDGAHSVRLAGFGNTDVFSTGGYGIRRMVDVPLASNDPQFGADAATEFVAGAPFLDRDSCNGDSGGPAYVQADGEWFLIGATSRATASTVRPCGDGGIYVRVPVYEDWIGSVPNA